MRPSIAVFALTASVAAWPAATWLDAGADEIVRFAVIGDNGTGKTPQYEVGARLAAARAGFPFEFVIMLGDNLYGSSTRGLRGQVRATLRAAAAGRRGVLRRARQPRQAGQPQLPALQHGRRALLHVRQRHGPLRRPRHEPMDPPSSAGSKRRCRRQTSLGRSSTSIIRSTPTAIDTAPPWSCARCSSRCWSATA